MVKRAWYIAICFTVLFSGRLFAQETGAVQLRYRYPPDKAIVYEEHVRMRVEYQQNSERRIDTQSRSSHDLIFTLRLAGTTDSGGQKLTWVPSDIQETVYVSYDLRRKNFLGRLADEVFAFTLSPLGTISDYTPPSYRKFRKKYTRREVEDVARQVELTLYCLPRLPEQPVGVGDSWKEEHTYPFKYRSRGPGGTIQLSREFTVKKERKEDGMRCFEIEEKSVITTLETAPQDGRLFQLQKTDTRTGKWIFNIEAGLTQKYEAKYHLLTTMTELETGDPERMETSVNGSYKIELKGIE